jgi:feruloyl esterase
LTFAGSNLDFRRLDISTAVAAADKGVGKVINSADPDLRAFKQHGGKIIHYHGWADAALAPMNSVNYYNEVRAVLAGKPTSNLEGGSFKEIQDFYRLFMVPGMGHCGGGTGATEFGAYIDPPIVDADHDIMKALERWVEQGIAPEKIIATHFTDADPARAVQFQRPLCPFPRVARYDGRGSPADPASFTCRH